MSFVASAAGLVSGVGAGNARCRLNFDKGQVREIVGGIWHQVMPFLLILDIEEYR